MQLGCFGFEQKRGWIGPSAQEGPASTTPTRVGVSEANASPPHRNRLPRCPVRSNIVVVRRQESCVGLGRVVHVDFIHVIHTVDRRGRTCRPYPVLHWAHSNNVLQDDTWFEMAHARSSRACCRSTGPHASCSHAVRAAQSVTGGDGLRESSHPSHNSDTTECRKAATTTCRALPDDMRRIGVRPRDRRAEATRPTPVR